MWGTVENRCPKCSKELELMVLTAEVEGQRAGDYYVCHECKKLYPVCEVYSRVSGYLRPVRQWNNGKKQEFKDRKTYKIKDRV